MENNNDKLIKDFFGTNKKEISDNDFSRNVMKALPEKKKTQWIIPTFSLIGFYISLFLIDVKELISKIYFLIAQINPIYFIVFLICIPFAFLFLWYAHEKNYSIFN